MNKLKQSWLVGAVLTALLFIIPITLSLPRTPKPPSDPWASINKKRAHLDHTHFFNKEFNSPQEVTKACLECHEAAATDLMKTAHWNWEGEEVDVPGHDTPIKIGKKNLINNFCIGIQGNWISCTSCHAGYGWSDAGFDFTRAENVDCLICHDWSGIYAKGNYGLPQEGISLMQVARKVGYPRRENCGMCHIYGGGGMGVKHGDLDNSLVNPSEDIDVHMGRHNLLCIDCHVTEKHNIKGKAFSVSVNHRNGIGCSDCHIGEPHKDTRINAHLASLACQTCHIPTYARKAPTKTDWDWSKAGDSSREDDPHHYLKIKGEFIYDQDIVPEYRWFNLKGNRYLLGDLIDPEKPTELNAPMGDITDREAKIWPFKIHRALQPYDKKFKYLLQPVTSGKGGYWHTFDWQTALKLGEEFTGLPYSGEYGFSQTHMLWPLSHMVAPATGALECQDCHSDKSRFNWAELGYEEDPAKSGDRFTNKMITQPQEVKK